MISQLILDRALARWKSRKTGRGDQTPPPTVYDSPTVVGGADAAAGESSYDSSYQTTPGPEMVGDTASGALLIGDPEES